MKRISQFFKLHEVACQCGCGFNRMSQDTLDIADAIRQFQGSPITCGSGCRCVDHNAEEGGASRSRHLPRPAEGNTFEADAMDLHVEDAQAVADFLEANYPSASYLVYDWGIHIDTRPEEARYTRR